MRKRGSSDLRRAILAVSALVAAALGQPVSAHAGCSDITPTRPGEVYLFRGLGNIYSFGPDEMADQFSDLGMRNCVDNHVNWTGFADDILDRSYRSDISYPIIIIGHSLGARAAVSMANYLGKHEVPVAYVAMFDPVEPTEVHWNIGEVVNYYVKIPLTNKLVRPGDGFTGTIENVGLSGWSGISHFNIDNSKKLQFSIYARALALSDAAWMDLLDDAETEELDSAQSTEPDTGQTEVTDATTPQE